MLCKPGDPLGGDFFVCAKAEFAIKGAESDVSGCVVFVDNR